MAGNFLIGITEVLLTLICFGSTFVPIKKFDGGDGFFVQWIMCTGIFFVGFIVNWINGFGPFYPVACIGGFFWALGNVVQVPIMKRLGMAISILVWNSVNCIIGWTAGFFGFFGLEAKPASIPWINFIGVFCILLGAVFFACVKKTEEISTLTDLNKKGVKHSVSGVHLLDSTLNKPSVSSMEGIIVQNNTVGNPISEDKLLPKQTITNSDIDDALKFGLQDDKTSPSYTMANSVQETSSKFGVHKDRIVGLVMALLAGVAFGFNVIPVMYIQDNDSIWPDAPENGIAYIFSHFCGIFITSSVVFIGYCIFRKNTPQVNPQIIMPSFFAGILWATAQSLFFAATEILTSSVTYPIVTMVPGCIAALWSVFYFREIRGKRDLIILSVAIGVTSLGTFLVAISK